MWKTLLFPVALASVVPFLHSSPSVSGIDDADEQLSFFSRGVKVEQQPIQYFQNVEVNELNNTMALALTKRYVFETTAPPSTFWQGANGVQWDEWSQDVVVKAWAGMMDMARFANATLSLLLPDTAAYQLFQDQTIVVEGICQAMKKDPTRNTPAYLLCYRSFLAANNLAYGQLFAADTEQLPTIISKFERIITETENLQGNGNSVPSAQGFVRDGNLLYLTMGPSMLDLDGKNVCDGGIQAFAVVASGTKEFSANPYVSENAWIIHFCPAFFQLPRMENQRFNLANGKITPEAQCNLDVLDSTARALLHEVTHLPWVLNTNYRLAPPEKYGYLLASSASAKYVNVNQAPATRMVSSKNADSYAWMAVYNYWNSMKECKGIKYTGQYQIPGSCNTDVWPSTPVDKAKPIKNQWNAYEKEK